MLLPENLCYWLNVTKLYGWLLSGIVTAMLVIAINEGIAYFRNRASRRRIVALILCEITYNVEGYKRLLKFKQQSLSPPLSCSCCESMRLKCVEFLPNDLIYEIFGVYAKFPSIKYQKL